MLSGCDHAKLTWKVSSIQLCHGAPFLWGYLVWVAYRFNSGSQLWFGFSTLEHQGLVCCCIKLFPGGDAYFCLNCRCLHLYNLHCLKCHYYLLKRFLLVLADCILWLMIQPCAMPFWWGSGNRALWFLFPFCCLLCSLITFISATLKLMRLLGYVKENPVLISVLISCLCIFFFLSVMCSESQLLTCCDGCNSFGLTQSFISQSKCKRKQTNTRIQSAFSFAY